MAFSPWAQANKIANIFGVQNEVLRSGAKWAGRWEGEVSKTQSKIGKVTSLTSGRVGRVGNTSALKTIEIGQLIPRDKQQQIIFAEHKAERERRDAEKAEAAAQKLLERARKADLKEAQRLEKAALAEQKKADRLMKEAQRTMAAVYRAMEAENKALAKAKMQRYETPQEKRERLQSAARFVVRPSVAISKPGFTKVPLPKSIQKYAGDIEHYAGGAAITINRKSTYIRKLGHQDLRDYKVLARIMKEVKATAIEMSQGDYKLNELARMNHPYAKRRPSGIGRLTRLNPPAGATKADIVNKQSGEFARSWQMDFTLTSAGFEARLENDAPWAWWLAHGTSKMRAHGPFKAAFALHMPQINKEFARIALDAQRQYLQKEAEKQVLKTMTGKEKIDTVERWRKQSAMYGMAGGVLQ